MASYGHPTLIGRVALATIAGRRFVRGTNVDSEVAQASAPTDALVGISDEIDTAASAELSVVHEGIVELELGGAVAFGDLLTSDADGKGVVAKNGERFGAIALENGAEDEIITARVVTGVKGAPRTIGAELAFAAGDCAPAATALEHGAVYQLGATAGASTLTLPADAPDGIAVSFVANGADNGHTITVRDATGPAALTAALTASKRLFIRATKADGKWYAGASVGP